MKPTLRLALACLALATGAARADIITATEGGFPGGGVLDARFVGDPEPDGSYQLRDLTDAGATFTVNGVLTDSLGFADLVQFTFNSPADFTFDFATQADAIEGTVIVQDGITFSDGEVGYTNPQVSFAPYQVTVTASAVPEPASFALLALGLPAALAWRRRRRARVA